MTYCEYLNTDHWQNVKRERLEMDGYECQFCGSKKNLNVHHISYKNLGREDVTFDLVTLCEPCHLELHRLIETEKPYADDLYNRWLEESSAVLSKIAEKYIDDDIKHLSKIVKPIVAKNGSRHKPTILRVINRSMDYCAGKYIRKDGPWYNSGSKSIYIEAMKLLPRKKLNKKEDKQ